MDEPLLRILQSIKQIEDDPSMQFHTKEIDLATFIPKHDNVIVVDQQCDPNQLILKTETGIYAPLSPGTLSSAIQSSGGRLISNKLSTALELAFSAYRSDEVSSEWTIILKEGLFINPLGHFLRLILDPLPHLTLEIVGLKDVRISLTHDSADTFFSKDANLAMRNVRIYDFRENPCKMQGLFEVEANCHLEDVKIHAPEVLGVWCNGPDSRVSMKGCSLNISLLGVNRGVIRAENCLIITREYTRVSKGATFFMYDVVFRGPGIRAKFSSGIVIDGCKFEAVEDSESPALDIWTASELDCRRTTFLGYKVAVASEGSGTTALLRHCNFFGGRVPAGIKQNANLLVADSFIQSDYLLMVNFNVKGKVEFLRNRLSPSTKRIIFVDSVSKKPIVDLHDVTYTILDVPRPLKAKDKQISKTEKIRAETFSRPHASASEKNHVWSLLTEHGGKCCSKCGLEADQHQDMSRPDTIIKFQYCGGCRAICYCSKECQTADWEDHRLICPRKKASKSSKGQSESKKKGKGSKPKGGK